MLFLGACSTAEQAASPGIDQPGFAHTASTEKSAEPPVVTAGELVQQVLAEREAWHERGAIDDADMRTIRERAHHQSAARVRECPDTNRA